VIYTGNQVKSAQWGLLISTFHVSDSGSDFILIPRRQTSMEIGPCIFMGYPWCIGKIVNNPLDGIIMLLFNYSYWPWYWASGSHIGLRPQAITFVTQPDCFRLRWHWNRRPRILWAWLWTSSGRKRRRKKILKNASWWVDIIEIITFPILFQIKVLAAPNMAGVEFYSY